MHRLIFKAFHFEIIHISYNTGIKNIKFDYRDHRKKYGNKGSHLHRRYTSGHIIPNSVYGYDW